MNPLAATPQESRVDEDDDGLYKDEEGDKSPPAFSGQNSDN